MRIEEGGYLGTMPKASHAREVLRFTDIPNVGKAMERDFRALGFASPGELAGQDAFALYQRMCSLSGTRQDPCVLDTYLAVCAFMDGGEPLPWWDFTRLRKERWPNL